MGGMYLAYLDESGDAGTTGSNSPTDFFAVACVVIEATRWLDPLDSLTHWRRYLRDAHGLSTRAEIKASAGFLRGGGAFKGLQLDRNGRMQLYSDSLQHVVANIPAKVFAIAIEKAPAAQRGWVDPRVPAWTFAFQRLERYAKAQSGHVMVFPDDGHDFLLKRLLRKGRRYHQISGHFGNVLRLPMSHIVEDPNSRQSHESYFIQLADWMAFAAHRSTYVDPKGPYSSGLWDQVTPLHLAEVNRLAGGPPAIVRYP